MLTQQFKACHTCTLVLLIYMQLEVQLDWECRKPMGGCRSTDFSSKGCSFPHPFPLCWRLGSPLSNVYGCRDTAATSWILQAPEQEVGELLQCRHCKLSSTACIHPASSTTRVVSASWNAYLSHCIGCLVVYSRCTLRKVCCSSHAIMTSKDGKRNAIDAQSVEGFHIITLSSARCSGCMAGRQGQTGFMK